MDKLRGFREFYPDEMRSRRVIFDASRKVSQLFGYEEISFPSVESLDLFRMKSGEEIVDQTYSFRDKGGREITLIPEATPSVSRMLAERKELPRPVRWFSFEKYWRYEEPQAGRAREFYQYNADLFGPYSEMADAEMIGLAGAILNELSLKGKYSFRVSHRGFIEKVLSKLGVSNPAAVLPVLDRYHKTTLETTVARLIETGVPEKSIDQLISILKEGSKLDKIEDLFADTGIDLTGIEEIGWLKRVGKLLESYSMKDIVFDASVVRGFTYYTGIVFEAFDLKGENRAILGGGRYDNLLSVISGNSIPAVGFAMGDVVLEIVMKSLNTWPEDDGAFTVTVCFTSGESSIYALDICNKLRKRGIPALISPETRSLSTQLKDASRHRSRFSVIVGDKEIAQKGATIRDMADGSQVTFPVLEAIKFLDKKRNITLLGQ